MSCDCSLMKCLCGRCSACTTGPQGLDEDAGYMSAHSFLLLLERSCVHLCEAMSNLNQFVITGRLALQCYGEVGADRASHHLQNPSLCLQHHEAASLHQFALRTIGFLIGCSRLWGIKMWRSGSTRASSRARAPRDASASSSSSSCSPRTGASTRASPCWFQPAFYDKKDDAAPPHLPGARPERPPGDGAGRQAWAWARDARGDAESARGFQQVLSSMEMSSWCSRDAPRVPRGGGGPSGGRSCTRG